MAAISIDTFSGVSRRTLMSLGIVMEEGKRNQAENLNANGYVKRQSPDGRLPIARHHLNTIDVNDTNLRKL